MKHQLLTILHAPDGTLTRFPWSKENARTETVTDYAGNSVPLQVLGSFTIKAAKTATLPQVAAAIVPTQIPMIQMKNAAPSWLQSDGEIL